ncbi:Protein EMSY-LIKE 4 [Ananas comosus]|uniref:Protein EMSY-LIKE 4 n=1 Tax=Ananas comosus TaxID=4615 RepID=A0A199UT11_ANACO|nr:Protein EMSY-LIKE 4 [Ananas comosus]
MKFKERDRVEVLRKNTEVHGSWFPATISSVHGNRYAVKYEQFFAAEGEPVVEKVCREDVRPLPPPDGSRKRWVLGEMAEVFDLHSWRLGKVAKVLKNNCVVIRLFGSIQLREFHVSKLRVRQAWRDDRWVAIDKVGEQKQLNKDMFPRFDRTADLSYGRVNLKNPNSTHTYSSDYLVRGIGKKRPATSNTNMLRTNKCGKAKAAPLQVDKRNANTFARMRVVIENECSVASCSGNELECTKQETTKSTGSSNCLSDDALSSHRFRNEKNRKKILEDELAANVHQLELQAYRSTVQAFYASGPLSWEQESLLTNLRLSLNISNEEHLLQLRHLLSA